MSIEPVLKKGYLLLILICSLLGFPWLWQEISLENAFQAPLITKSPSPPSSETLEALQQPYRYLGAGKQSVAFLSEDGKWVLKFFKKKYIRAPFIARCFNLDKKKYQQRFGHYCESYLIAEKEFKQETALAYVHLGPSTALPDTVCKDRLGISHSLNLNEYPFVMQKRVESFYSLLTGPLTRQMIDQFLGFVAKRMAKGVADRDQEIGRNFGTLGGAIVQIDPGRLYLDTTLNEQKRRDLEWWRSTHKLRRFLETNAPEEVAFFDQRLKAWQEETSAQSPV
ncbi:MAG: hypothetical protein KGI80_04305 [Verrucomicrobiota bacterium]|nr:hypothetical protein [Verrucomicrobiota bacterium]